MGYIPKVLYAVDIGKIPDLNPDLIFAPYLKSYLPKEVYQNYPTFVFHPGIRGDRGAYSLEWALIDEKKEWGGVWLKAKNKLDSGNIYASGVFALRDATKSSIYRREEIRVAIKTLPKLLENIKRDNKLDQIQNPIHKKPSLQIDWQRDNTKTIIKKINSLDSFPGIKDEILGVEVHLFGAWEEERLKAKPKEIVAKRDGAICLGTVDGAIWITHLKEPNRFKLPATYVLKDRLKGVKEDRLPLLFDESYKTFYETSVEIKDEVAYLKFDFHNGAMSAAQCIRLKYAVDYLKERCKVLVLMGGREFFSNGIHLNILEDSAKQGEDGWANINAMNDLISSIVFADEIVTIASFHTNAGAGGVFMALACDFVVAREGVVLNPHYKTLGLTGSEYHTYTLPKRVGEKKAKELLDSCLPISANEAKKIGMIDDVFKEDCYLEELHKFALSRYDEDFTWEKQEYLEENQDKIEAFKEAELEVMYPEFWDERSSFHRLRREFVYKICPTATPKRFM